MRLRALLIVVTFASLCHAQADAVRDFMAGGNWQGMWGSPPVTQKADSGVSTLEFVCNYGATKAARASWDCRLDLDLATSEGVQFEIRCDDPAPVGSWSLYFQSGEGWYNAAISPGGAGKWTTIRVRKEETGIEGTPRGWAHISAMRISAWRGQDRDTRFWLRSFAVLPATPGIMVVRGESAAAAQRGEIESVKAFTGRMSLGLRELGLPCSMISDLDLDAQRLRDVPLLVLPHNPTMPPDAIKTITDYMKAGGKALGFYAVPGELMTVNGMRYVRHVAQTRPGSFAEIVADMKVLPGAPDRTQQSSWNIQLVQPASDLAQVAAQWRDSSGNATGMPAILTSPSFIYMSHVLLQDDPQHKAQLLLAMVGKLWPEAWRIAAESSLRTAGAIGEYSTFEAAAQGLGQSPASGEAIKRATALRDTAQSLIAQQRFPEALATAGEIRSAMTEAFARAQVSAPGEFRAMWCHRANGIDGMSWDESMKLLADNGFTAIIPNMAWGGLAFYPSEVLPVSPTVGERGDGDGDDLKQCIAAARKYGVQVHVWKVNWNMGGRAPRDFVQRMKRDGRTQVSYDQKANDQWLCPSSPANQQLEVDAMVEVASKYDVDGIHFDYIRYPGPDGCFCAPCRERFEKRIGRTIANWPADVRKDASLEAQWNDFRRENITRVVAGVSEKVRASGKPVKISAAVFSNWPADRDGVGQDWKLWCEKGYLDFVCPMDYTASNDDFRTKVGNQIQWASKTPMYPGIGLSTWSGTRRDLVRLIDQIKITRESRTGGFVIFEYNAQEAKEIVPLCGMGITRK